MGAARGPESAAGAQRGAEGHGRAALALTEAATRLSDREEPIPDEIWDEAARHYDEPALSALLLQISGINLWNRLNVAIRQPAGPVEAPTAA